MRSFIVIIIFCCAVLVDVQAKLTPQQRYKIIHGHFGEILREKIRGGLSSFKSGKQEDHILSATENIVNDDANPQSELHAAINPADTGNIVVSAIQQGAGTLNYPIYYTQDFGNTWRKSSFYGQSL